MVGPAGDRDPGSRDRPVGSGAATPPAARTRRGTRRWALGFLLAYAAFAVATAWDTPWRPEWDAATYVSTARSLAAGEGYRFAGEPFFLRPPGLAWALAPLVGTEPGARLRAVHVLLALCAAAGAAGFLALLGRGRPAPAPAATALAATALAFTAPLVARQLHWVHSEFPFLALFLPGVALLDRTLRPDGRAWHAVGGALLVAASYWVRSVAVLALPALALLALVRGGGARRRGLLAAGVVVLGALPWMLHARAVQREATRPPDQLLLFDYSTALLHVDPGDPGSPLVGLSDVAARVADNAPKIARALAAGILHTESGLGVLAVLLLAAAGAVRSVRAGPAVWDGFAALYALLLCVYFDFAERLVAPLALAVVAYAVRAGVAAVRATPLGPRASGALLLALLLVPLGANLAALPRAVFLADRPVVTVAGVEQPDVTHREHWRNVRRIGAWLRRHTARDAVVLCHRAPSLSVYSGRRCRTYRFPRGRDLLARYRPDVVVFDGVAPAGLQDHVVARAERLGRIDLGEARILVATRAER